MNKKIYTEDDYCDVYEGKICDNCGDCLQQEGIDVRAIKIEEISKTVEENEILEAKFKTELEKLRLETDKELEEKTITAEEFLVEDDAETEYVDAFENIEYLDDMELFDELNLEEMTEEVFPGVRRFKNK
ncbi:hypothetical protein [Clostridium gasigenes]|uniref:Uncharacterized protein n=1 Tax=Clostridium gasigenes TaxID=94869 RepID=A0A1H0NDD8_9CLOT|nr:hypothetical protein [Clostridium gasigenes]MBU3087471.1 hypothetical protein [Clostridium gasigenes]SDO90668.1 hypothetical protein SAMN04488529_101792 [Clostridium gasigenes]